jgi:hypothetical protein
MTKKTLVDDIHEDRTHLRRTFGEIREALEKARSREDLTELYKQAVYMILMTHSSPVDEKFDREMSRRRGITEREFTRTVRMINRQAKKLGMEADYDENWENLATNGYEAKDENLLEAQSSVGIVKE